MLPSVLKRPLMEHLLKLGKPVPQLSMEGRARINQCESLYADQLFVVPPNIVLCTFYRPVPVKDVFTEAALCQPCVLRKLTPGLKQYTDCLRDR